MNKNREHNYEAQNMYKIEGAATPAQEQATIDMEDSHFQKSVAVLYDSSNWIVQFLKPSGRKLNRSFRAMKSKSLLRIFLCKSRTNVCKDGAINAINTTTSRATTTPFCNLPIKTYA